MKENTFVGISKRMQDAMDAEGLRIYRCDSGDGIYYEGTFYTGMDWEKLCAIDLRGKTIEDECDADTAFATKLEECRDNFDIWEELQLYLNDSIRGGRETPEPERLYEDMKEQAKCLKRFSDVAWAVANNEAIPPAPEEAYQTDNSKDSFYVIRNAFDSRCYWKDIGCGMTDAWGDVLTAERFDTLEEAHRSIRMESAEYKGVPIRIETETTTRLFAIPEDKPKGE